MAAIHRLTFAFVSPVHRPTVAIAASTATNRLKFFGGVSIETLDGPISGRAAQRHRIALLAILSSTRRRCRSREQLVGLLWPDTDSERGRKLLSDSIYRINQALGGDAITGAGEDVCLDRNHTSSDVADFEVAVATQRWQQAIDLYSGAFLDGFFLPNVAEFDQWLENERVHHARIASKAIETLAVSARDAGRLAESVELWQKLAAIAPDDSRVAIELMNALERSGNRAGALRYARVHTLLLRETIGIEPSRAVRELTEQISQREEMAPTPAPESKSERTIALVSSENSPATNRHDASAGRDSRPCSGDDEAFDADDHISSDIDAFAPMFSRTQSHERSIAILPFSSLTDGENNTCFADGMSEEIMHLISQKPGVRVASRTSAFAYRDLRLDVREVARRLRVEWVLEGSVRRSGNRLRIVARLIDAAHGFQTWSESFDRTLNDVFELQQEIAGAISESVAPAVTRSVA